MSTPQDPKRIKTTQTAFEIIECIKEHQKSTLSEIAADIDISKSTVHTHLQTLCEMRYIVKEDKKYRLGLPFLTLGGHVQHTGQYRGLFRIAKPEIDELTEQTEERAQLVIEEEGYGFHLYQSIGNRAVLADTHPGSEIPLNGTAVGKSILAHMDEDYVHEILQDRELVSYTSNTMTDLDRLFDRFDQIRERGYSVDREERVPGIYCVAAPVISDDNEVVGGVSVSLPKKRAQPAFFEDELPEMVMNAARVIGLNTTYS